MADVGQEAPKLGVPYEGVENLRPESKAAVQEFLFMIRTPEKRSTQVVRESAGREGEQEHDESCCENSFCPLCRRAVPDGLGRVAGRGVGYRFGWGDVTLIYRYLDYEFKSGERLRDLTISGPAIGASWRW